jgi:hypothetical protein
MNQGLKPSFSLGFNVAAEAATHKTHSALRAEEFSFPAIKPERDSSLRSE